MTQELLDLKRKPCTASTITLSDPFQEAPGILTKLTSEGDIEAFLTTFEQVKRRE